jgi:hypothetical protein
MNGEGKNLKWALVFFNLEATEYNRIWENSEGKNPEMKTADRLFS